jgi:hypothetical protein
VCDGAHFGQRLARWLLMNQDRACSDKFHVALSPDGLQ